MCHFLTLVVRAEDEAALRDVLKRHDRYLSPITNPSVAELLAPGERQYLTAHSCDCGTPVGRGRKDAERVAQMFATQLPRQRARLSRLGWSEAKIERWTLDRIAADERRGARHSNGTVEEWVALFDDLSAIGIPEAGMLLHYYSGALDDEFDCAREPGICREDRAGGARDAARGSVDYLRYPRLSTVKGSPAPRGNRPRIGGMFPRSDGRRRYRAARIPRRRPRMPR